MSGKGHNKPWSKKGEKGTGRGERKQVVVKAAELEISAPTTGTTFPVGGGAECGEPHGTAAEHRHLWSND